MNRRHFLATSVASVGAVSVIAGCIGDSESEDNGRSSSDDIQSTNSTDSESSSQVQPPETCPDYGSEEADGFICYNTVDTETAPLFLKPSSQLATEGDSIEFTLHNQSSQKLETDPRHWSVYYHSNGNWDRTKNTSALTLEQKPKFVSPDETLTRTLHIDTGPVKEDESAPIVEGRPPQTLRGPDSGYYALDGICELGTDESSDVFLFAAMFRVQTK